MIDRGFTAFFLFIFHDIISELGYMALTEDFVRINQVIIHDSYEGYEDCVRRKR
jgi:hypothetical protein